MGSCLLSGGPWNSAAQPSCVGVIHVVWIVFELGLLYHVHMQELHAHINGSISEETVSKLVSLKQSKDKSWQASSQLKLGKHLSLAE